jgi:hypothetical protein
MKRPLALLILGISLGSACGGGGDGGAAADAPATTVEAPTTTTSTTAAEAPADGTLLEATDAPPPWTPAQGATVSFTALAEPGVGASSITCPATLAPAPGTSVQCVVYADEGGPYAATTVGPNGGPSTVTLLCQEGDVESLDFSATLQVTGRVATTGPGATDGQGRFFSALAMELDDGVHWFVLRRPAGEDCPVVWDLGVGESIGASSSLGGATFPLADGPTCTRLHADGLVVKAGSADGICT